MKHMKRRLVAGALIAFLILLLLIIGAIAVHKYVQIETEGNEFIDRMLDDAPHYARATDAKRQGRPWGMRIAPGGFYDLLIDPSGQILRQDAIGIPEQSGIDLDTLIRPLLQGTKDRGKLQGFKYGILRGEESIRIILLDQSTQLQAMYSTLQSVALVGLVCLALMFLLLQPIARYIARADMAAKMRERQFITNASHELKTPVAVIQSNIEALQMMQGENKWSRNVHSQVERLNHMISQLLLVERLAEQHTKQKPVVMNLYHLIKSIADELWEVMDQRKLTLSLQCPGVLLYKGDEQALLQLLRLLMDNAAKYATEASTIFLSAAEEKKKVILCLENKVDTLPACSPQQLFERFNRGGITRQTGDLGCGIGLSAAMDIANLQHGKIEAAYPDEHTFRICVYLPQ